MAKVKLCWLALGSTISASVLLFSTSHGFSQETDSSEASRPNLNYLRPQLVEKTNEAGIANEAGLSENTISAARAANSDHSSFSNFSNTSNTAVTAASAEFADNAEISESASFSNSAAQAVRSDQADNSDLLNNRSRSFFQNAGNLQSGIINNSRLAADLGERSIGFANSGGDAVLLEGNTINFFEDTTNLTSGVLNDNVIGGTLDIDISGNSSTADEADNALFAERADTASAGPGSGSSFEGTVLGNPAYFELQRYLRGPVSETHTVTIPSGATRLAIEYQCSHLSSFQGISGDVPAPFSSARIQFLGVNLPINNICSIGAYDEVVAADVSTEEASSFFLTGSRSTSGTILIPVPEQASRARLFLEAAGIYTPERLEMVIGTLNSKNIRTTFYWLK